MADDVWNWCERRRAFGRTVTVKTKYADFQQITRSRSQPVVVTTHHQLRQAAIDLVRSVFPAAKGIRLVGVTMSNFAEATAAEAEQLPIFAEAAEA